VRFLWQRIRDLARENDWYAAYGEARSMEGGGRPGIARIERVVSAIGLEESSITDMYGKWDDIPFFKGKRVLYEGLKTSPVRTPYA